MEGRNFNRFDNGQPWSGQWFLMVNHEKTWWTIKKHQKLW